MDEMGEFIGEFLTESYENLDQLDQDLVALEANPQETETLASIFRTIHTLKGTCGFLGFNKLEGIAHVGENLLSKLREGELPVTQETISTLLATGDAIRQILDSIEQDSNEGVVDYSELVATLTRLQNGGQGHFGVNHMGDGTEPSPGSLPPPEDLGIAPVPSANEDPETSKGSSDSPDPSTGEISASLAAPSDDADPPTQDPDGVSSNEPESSLPGPDSLADEKTETGVEIPVEPANGNADVSGAESATAEDAPVLDLEQIGNVLLMNIMMDPALEQAFGGADLIHLRSETQQSVQEVLAGEEEKAWDRWAGVYGPLAEKGMSPAVYDQVLEHILEGLQKAGCSEANTNQVMGVLTPRQRAFWASAEEIGEDAATAVKDRVAEEAAAGPAAEGPAAAETSPATADAAPELEQVGNVLLEKILMDPALEQAFGNADLIHLRAETQKFVQEVLSGEECQAWDTWAAVYAPLVENGMTPGLYDHVLVHVCAGLQKAGYPNLEVNRIMGVVTKRRGAFWLSPPTAAEGSAASVDAAPPVGKPDAAPPEEEITAPGAAPDNTPQADATRPAEPPASADAGAIPKKETANSKGSEAKTASSRQGSESIRVDVQLLDNLMNLVGELVLSRNQLVQFAASRSDSAFLATTQNLDQLTSELQESVMKTRMQPIGNLWSKYPRVVRDLSVGCGKQVRLEMEGKETELDKTLIEAIKDPLTHIVRNSVDHGIEMPEVREAAGKPAEGCLSLRAYHEGGQVNIEIVDDGGGIDPERIKKKALEKSVITPDQAARMNDRELVNLVFAPGFSTAEKVSNISGRGVGMDVVRTNIEKIGGTVEINSVHGQGTTLRVRIPLTLAIIPALVITNQGGRYCIPQVNLQELVRLDPEKGHLQVEFIKGSPVLRLRGNLLPLVYLTEVLSASSSKQRPEAVNIIVLEASGRQFGLVVDRILDTEEIVVKPLSSQLKGINAYSGVTIMGDGKPALILDVMGLAQKSNVLAEETNGGLADEAEGGDQGANGAGEKQTFLVVGVGVQSRMAVPLSMVTRLEQIKDNATEYSGDHQVVQYRGEIMPLVFISSLFGGGTAREENQTLQVVVYSKGGRSVGVVVESIVDIIEDHIQVKTGSHRHGILGKAIIQGRVTELLDIEGVIRQTDPDFFDAGIAAAASGAG